MDRARFGVWNRRRFGVALPSVLVTPWCFAESHAVRGRQGKKKRCRRINRCPQRGCCECLINSDRDSSALCLLVDATEEAAIIDACVAACPPGTQISIFNVAAGAANFCDPNDFCTRVVCPVAL